MADIQKLKELAMAAKQGGSSDAQIWNFVNQVTPSAILELIARAEAAEAALTAEPVAYYWFNESDYGRDVSLTSPEEDDDAADALENGWQVEPLIRIPKLNGGDEC